MTDTEVKTRVSVESSGDTAALRDVASGVDQLSSAAAGAEPSIERLISGLEELGKSAGGTAEAQKAVADFSSALKDVAAATGVEEQSAAVDKALEAWRRLGTEIPEVLDKSAAAAKDYQAVIEQLQAQQERLADPLTASLAKAEDAFGKLGASVDGSMSGANDKLAQARGRIDEYREALEAAKKAGADVTGDQIQQLQRLEAEYDKAEHKIADYAATKRKVAKDIDAARTATSGEVTQINSLSDVVTAASPRWGQYLGVVGQVTAAFNAGYEAGTALRSVLNQLTDGGFDRAVQGMLGMAAAADKLVDGLDSAARSMETLANQRHLFEKLGLEGFSNDVQKNAAALEAHAHRVADDKAEVSKLKAEYDKLLGSLGLSREKLDEQAESLARVAASFAAQNKSLSSTDLSQIFGKQIQTILDSYARLKTDVPPALASLAAAWGITTSSVQQAAQRHKAVVDQLTTQITGVAKVTSTVLADTTKAIEETFSKINVSRLSPEQLDRARGQVQGLVDAYTQAGQQIPQELTKIAASVGVFQTQSDLMAQKCAEAATSAGTMGSGLERAGESALKMSRDVGDGSRSIEQIAPGANQAQMSLEDLKNKYGEAGREARRSGEEINAGSAAGARGTEALGDSGEKIDHLGSQARGAGEAVATAGEKIQGAAKSAAALGEVNINLAKPVSEIGALQKAADATAPSLAKLQAALDSLKAAAAGAVAPLISQLDQVIAKAHEAAEAVKAVTGGK